MADDSDHAWASGNENAHYVLRLYVTGATPRSARAISNARRICDAHLTGRFELEVIDIYEQPLAALRDQILAAPTLVRLVPEPIRKIIGDLSDELKTLRALGVRAGVSDVPL